MKVYLQELIGLAYNISNSGKMDIFITYSPHVNTVAVLIYKDGWAYSESGLYLHDDGTLQDGYGGIDITAENLKNCNNQIKSLCI